MVSNKKTSTLDKLFPVMRNGEPTEEEVQTYTNALIGEIGNALTRWKRGTVKVLNEYGFNVWTGEKADKAAKKASANVKRGKVWGFENIFLDDLEAEAVRLTKKAGELEKEAKKLAAAARIGVPTDPEKKIRADAKQKEFQEAALKANALYTWFYFLVDIPKTLLSVSTGQPRTATRIRRIVSVMLKEYIQPLDLFPKERERFFVAVEKWERGDSTAHTGSRCTTPYPDYLLELTDRPSKAVLDYAHKTHDELFWSDNHSVAFENKGSSATVLTVMDLLGDGLIEIPPQTVQMFQAICTLGDSQVLKGKEPPFKWPLDHVIRCFKNGGTVTKGAKFDITDTDREQAREKIRALGGLGILIEWPEKKNGTEIMRSAEGPLVSFELGNDADNLAYFELLALSPLYRHAVEIGQVERIEAAKCIVYQLKKGPKNGMLETFPLENSSKRRSLRRSDRTTALQYYLRSRIVQMQRFGWKEGKKQTKRFNSMRTIRLENAWIHARETDRPADEWTEWEDMNRNDQKRFRQLLNQILDGFKTTGFISGYDYVTERNGQKNRVLVDFRSHNTHVE